MFQVRADDNGWMDDDIEDYIDCLEGGLRDEVKNIVFALNNDRNQDRDPRTRLATWSFKISCYYQTYNACNP